MFFSRSHRILEEANNAWILAMFFGPGSTYNPPKDAKETPYQTFPHRNFQLREFLGVAMAATFQPTRQMGDEAEKNRRVSQDGPLPLLWMERHGARP